MLRRAEGKRAVLYEVVTVETGEEFTSERMYELGFLNRLVEPIYRRASGRWTRYRKHLEPALPKLAPWIASLGYDPVDDAV